MDIVGEDESHPLSSLMETLGTLIEAYEIQNIEDHQDLDVVFDKTSANRLILLATTMPVLLKLALKENG